MTNLETELRTVTKRMREAWPVFAPDLVAVPELADLTMRDLAVLLALSPGELVARDAVRTLIGDNADVVVSALVGHGLVSEEHSGYRMTAKGQAVLDRMIEQRISTLQRVLGGLSENDQRVILDSWKVLAHAAENALGPVKV